MKESTVASAIFSLSVTTLVTAMGMDAENRVQMIRGEYPAYTKADFDLLIEIQREEMERIHKEPNEHG